MRTAPIFAAIFFAVLCMSTASIMIRFCAAPAMVIALYRVAFTTGLAGLVEGRNLYKNLAAIGRRDLIYVLGAGFFLALHFAFWITSLGYTTVSSSVLFTNLQVIFVLILSVIFLREKLNKPIIIGIMVALMGCLFIAGGDLKSGKILGDMLALASGLFIAIYFLIGRKIRPRVGTFTYTFVVSAAAVIVLLLGTILGGWSLTGYPALDWVLFFLLALGPGMGGHAILNWALKYVQAPVVSVSILGESVGASILAYFIFQEHLLWYQIIGGLLILAGIYTASVYQQS
jgi:drug/metabolite transporter (DMT)-like permease